MKPIDGDEKKGGKDFLVVQLAKTSTLPMQVAGVQSLVGENQDPACRVVQPKTKKIQCMSEHFAPWLNSGVASLALRIQYKIVFNLEWSCL